MYLTLPSNTGDFTSNTTSSFRVKLPNPISLHGRWEIALTEIQYPVSWNTVKKADARIKLTYEYHNLKVPIEIDVHPGYYNDIHELIAAITYSIEKEGEKLPEKLFKADYGWFLLKKLSIFNPKGYLNWQRDGYKLEDVFERPEVVPQTKGDIKGNDELEKLVRNVVASDEQRQKPPKANMLSEALTFKYSALIKRVEIQMKSINALELPRMLQFALGFSQYTKLKKGLNVGEYNVDITAAENSFFTYCSIVKSQFVGNSLQKLLRAVPVPLSTLGTTVHKEFTTPHYIDIVDNNFDTVEIEIRNDSGSLIDFQFGKVILKLHLRRKPLLNL